MLQDTTVVPSAYGVPARRERFRALPARVGAMAATVFLLPVLAVLSILVLVTSGTPILYRGIRLGRGKRLFRMCKFRTLRPAAEQELGHQLVAERHRVVTPLGGFLRQTRLDELPQLLNVARGEMAFVGPRPVRPAVYEAQCTSIPGYDRRFDLLPGIVGYSQVFTPHGTPKTVRTRIDNSLYARKRRCCWKLAFLAYTAVLMLWAMARHAGGLIRLRPRLLSGRPERRVFTRVTPGDCRVILPADGAVLEEDVASISECCFRFRCADSPRTGLSTTAVLRTSRHDRRGRRITRHAHCRAEIAVTRQGAQGTDVVVRYDPLTPYDDYRVQQYFLNGSLAKRVR